MNYIVVGTGFRAFCDVLQLLKNPNNKIYMSLQNLAWQSAGYSTLEESEVDYYPSIQARYDHNMITE